MSRARKVAVQSHAGVVVCDACLIADSPALRLRGLLGRPELASGEGLLLRPTGSIHTWFMRFPIDAVFLDRELRILRVVDRMRPWRAAAARKARAVLELPAGEAVRRGIAPGDVLALGGAEQ
jgi:uncharacterized protein